MNKELDSELRINAYITMMECPSSALLRDIRESLETEEVNQVGSFVWTHLTNLMESSSPLKEVGYLTSGHRGREDRGICVNI